MNAFAVDEAAIRSAGSRCINPWQVLTSCSLPINLQVQIHEPILVAPEGPELQKVFESTFAEFGKAGLPINLVTYFDDVGETYPWVVKLPVSPQLPFI